VLTGEPALPATTWRLKSHLLRTRNLPTDRIRNYYSGSTLVAMPPKITAGDRTGSSTLNYMLGDHPSLSLGTGLGSTAITTDSNGEYFAEIRYYPWGTERYTYGTTPTSYHFTGQRLEDDIGLYYYGARWYDPSIMRFVQPDPIIPRIGEGGSLNGIGYVPYENYSALVVDYHETQFLEQLNSENRIKLQNQQVSLSPVPKNVQAFDRYAYSLNNPVKYTDPSGHCIWDLCIREGIGFVEIIILTGSTFLALEATQPGRPEAFAQTIVDIGEQAYQNISNSLASISQADKLPMSDDYPYNPPKQKGNPPYVRTHDGGFRDAQGNVWRRDKSGHGGPHWDVEHPDGSHTNVDDEGKVISGK
jgi:RHS repeat-associated protein